MIGASEAAGAGAGPGDAGGAAAIAAACGGSDAAMSIGTLGEAIAGVVEAVAEGAELRAAVGGALFDGEIAGGGAMFGLGVIFGTGVEG